MQIMLPISSKSKFFPREEFFFSKHILEVNGLPMIHLVVSHLKNQFPKAKFLFVVDNDDVLNFSIDKILYNLIGENFTLLVRSGDTNGALCSCLLAIDALDRDEPIIIANSDQIITEDIEKFLDPKTEDIDVAVITFNASHPRWSYARIDEDGFVKEVAEKRVISNYAIAGFYYFRKASDFISSAQRAIFNDASHDGAFYLSAAINEGLLAGLRVKSFNIKSSNYHSFYSPSRIDFFEKNTTHTPLISSSSERINVVIPAAGEGSRFAKANWKSPKPFIDIDGESMISKVIRNVTPKSSRIFLIIRDNSLENFYKNHSFFEGVDFNVTKIEGLTEGTACTVLRARKYIDNNEPLLIANSDQLVEFDVDDFVNDCLKRDLDGSILVFREESRDLKWSYARLSPTGLVVEVAEKKAISNLATVGIYFFKRGSDFVKSAIDMIAMNDRVNNEFYTCPVYNYLINSEAKIGVYELPKNGMHGLGTPEDLLKYIKLKKLPMSKDAP